ncbi:MAG: ABC transporter permease [Flavobacteriales bacterium]|nr:ABC transporter permease [Flavobacteriales bacterium]
MSKRTVITAEAPSFSEYFRNIWKYRGLIVTLAKRDLKIKYAQTALGIAWSFLQPLTAVIVFSLFFGLLLDVNVGYPYALFVFGGVLCWNLFIYIFSHGSTSLMNNQDLIRKLSFPKLILPASKVLVAFVEVGLTLLLIIPMMAWSGIPFSLRMLAVPFVLCFTAVLGLGVSLILAAATLRYRDLHHIIPFLVNFGIWFTPVFYPVSLIPAEYSELIYLNPMASLIEMMRWSLFGEEMNVMALTGLMISVIVLLIGLLYFKRVEDKIAELV